MTNDVVFVAVFEWLLAFRRNHARRMIEWFSQGISHSLMMRVFGTSFPF